jgi:hypothetical protein
MILKTTFLDVPDPAQHRFAVAAQRLHREPDQQRHEQRSS